MKLKAHREDVKYIELMAAALPTDNLIRLTAIAKRYQIIIRAFEQAINRHLKLSSLEFLKEHMNKEAVRVLKDAEK